MLQLRKSWTLLWWTMTPYSKPVLSTLLWFFGGTVYFLIEVAYKTAAGHPENISWTMLVVAIILTIPVERCGCELPWECPIWLQAFVCAVLVTVVELISGIVINLWLGMGVWDYSNLPFNFLGQICLPFSIAWYVLCLAFIPVFDFLRYAVEGGDKPTYRI